MGEKNKEIQSKVVLFNWMACRKGKRGADRV